MPDVMIDAARALRHTGLVYWVKVTLSTIFIWLARYLMLNCLVAAFSTKPMTLGDHQLALSKQVYGSTY